MNDPAVTKYLLYQDGAAVGSVPAGTLTYRFSGLVNGQTYTLGVAAADDAGHVSYTGTRTGSPAPGLSTPGGLGVASADNALTFDWGAVTGATGYVVSRDQGGPTVQLDASTRAYTFTGLVNGTAYLMSVYAVDGAGHRSYTATRSGTPTDSVAPLKRTGLAVAPGDGRVVLTWNANTDADLVTIRVKRGTAYVADLGPTATSYTDTGLTNGTQYGYKLLAVDDDGNDSGDTTGVNATPVDRAPAVPTGLAATPGDRTVSLAWTANSDWDLSGYRVYRDGVQVATVTAPATTYSDTGRTNGVTSSYTLTAVDATGNVSAASTAVSATPRDGTAPGAPTALAVTSSGDRSLTLGWTAPADTDIARYEVVSSGGAVVATTTPGTRTATLTGLVNGTAATFTVRAVDTSGNTGAASAPATGTPRDATAPGAPTALNAVAGESSVSLTWTGNTVDADVDGYRVYRDGAAVSPLLPAGSRSWADTGLTDYQTYSYTVRTHDTSGNYSADSTARQATPVDLTPPAVPSGLTAVRGDGSVTLSWDANTEPDLAGYGIYRDGALVTSVTAPTRTWTDTGLTNDTGHTWSVDAVDVHANRSARSTTASATPTDLTPPGVPTGLTAARGDGRVVLSWTANTETDVATYRVVRDGVEVATVAAGTTTSTDTGLTNDATYRYQLRAVDTHGNASALTTPAVAATPTDLTAPAVPTGLAATGGDGRVVLTWTANAEPDLASYRLYRDGSSTVLASTAAGTTTYTDTTVTNDLTYGYVLRAVDTHGNASTATATVLATPTDLTAPAAPTGLVATRGDSSVALRWTANTEPDTASYRVVRDGAVVATVNAPATSYTDTGLTNDTTYRYQLRAVDTHGNTSPASAPAVSATPVDLTPPAVPGGLTATRGDGSVALSWTPVGDGDLASYHVYRDGALLATVTAPTASYTDSGLTNDSGHSWTVSSVDTHGNESARSAAVTATPTDLTPPAVPTGLAAARGDGRVVLTWSANTEGDLATYRVVRDGVEVATVAAGTTTFTDTGLTNDTTYRYQLRAVDTHDNASALTTPAVAAVPTDLTPPAAPTGLAATRGDGLVALTWTANTESDLASYRVVRDGVVIATVSTPATSYTDTGLVNGTAHTYQLRAVDTHGNASALTTPGVSATPTDLTPPAAPTGLAGARGDGRVVLSWTANTEGDLASYRVVRDGVVVATVNAPATGYTDTGLTNDTAYSYRLVAVDTAGNASPASTPAVSATPTDLTAPATPAGLTAVRGDSSVALSWTAGSENDIASYRVVRDGVEVATVNAPATSYTDPGLTNGTTYRYQLRAVDTHGNASPASTPAVSATPTDLTPPAAPVGLATTRGDGGAVLSWTPNTEADLASYRVYRDGVQVAVVPAGTTTWTDSGLTNDRAYAYSLVAVDTSGNASARSATVGATPTDLTPPAAPTTPAATPSDHAVTLSWTASTSPDTTGYAVLVDGVQVATTTAPTTTVTVTGLVNGQQRSFTVVAVDGHGNRSTASAAVLAASADAVAPGAPTAVTATPGDASATVSWTAPADTDLRTYRVLRADGTTAAEVSAPTTSAVVSGLVNGTPVTFTVVVLDTSGNRSTASASVTVTPAAPVAPGPPAGGAGLGSSLAVSSDGRWLVVATSAKLEATDTNTAAELYRIDTTGAVAPRRVAPQGTGSATNATNTSDVAVSLSGRYVALATTAALVTGDTNGGMDVYRGDLSTTPTTWVLASASASGAASSSAGTLLESGTGVTATGPGVAISDDGSRVAFYSTVDDLVAGDGNGRTDVFVKDLSGGAATGPVVRASTAAGGANIAGSVRAQGPALALTPDGRYLAFTATGPNGPLKAYRKDLTTGALDVASRSSAANGSVDVDASRDTGDLAISADGRYVAFASASKVATATPTAASTYLLAYRKDLTTGDVVAVGTGQTARPERQLGLSPDGRYAVFTTRADLVAADANGGRADVYRRDLTSSAVVLVTATTAGTSSSGTGDGTDLGRLVVVSADVVVVTTTRPLVAADTNALRDVYRKDLSTGAVTALVGPGA